MFFSNLNGQIFAVCRFAGQDMNVVAKLLKSLGQMQTISFYPADKAGQKTVGGKDNVRGLTSRHFYCC